MFDFFNKRFRPEKLLQKGIDLYNGKKYSDAVDVLYKINEMPMAQYYIGLAQKKQGIQDPVQRDAFYKASVQWFMTAANNGVHEALYEYALYLLNYVKDQENGEKAMAAACEHDVPAALLEMGMICVRRGDVESAAKYFKRGAELNDTMCIYNYGVYLLENGHRSESIDWFKKGVEMGESRCLHNYAALLEEKGRIKDAQKYFKQSAEHGYPQSMYSLYLTHSDDIIEPIKWLKKSADAGFTKAIALLALKNYAKDKNLNAAISALKPSVQKGDVDCCAALYALLLTTHHMTEAQKIKALFDTNKVSNIYLIANALWELGDIEQSIKHYETAGISGDVRACVKLANYYGAKKRYREQKKWLDRGVNLRDLVSIHNTGVYYLSKAEQNNPDAKEEAVKHLLISLKGGYYPSAKALKYAIREMKNDTVKGYMVNLVRSIAFKGLAAGLLGDEAADLGTWVDYKLLTILGSVEDTVAEAEKLIQGK